jgi:hypothetical protein
VDSGVQGAPPGLTVRSLYVFGLALSAAIVLTMIAVLSLVLLGAFSMAGENTVRIENGERVADFGLPLRFATAHYEDGFSMSFQAGDDGVLNPWEIWTTGSSARFWADYAFFFVACLVPIVIALARRRARGRPPRPCARPS